VTAVIEAPRGGVMPDSTFLKQLIAVIRAEDSYGTWDAKSDAQLLADFIVTKEERRAIPIISDPEPEVLWRIEKFYGAVGLLIEKTTGLMASPMSKMSHEGFGRIILITGRLVALSRHLRDVHRFGFDSFEKLAEAGEKLAADAAAVIAAHPDAARA
jgi:probable nitrogen fixation protein